MELQADRASREPLGRSQRPTFVLLALAVRASHARIGAATSRPGRGDSAAVNRLAPLARRGSCGRSRANEGVDQEGGRPSSTRALVSPQSPARPQGGGHSLMSG